ncbi:heme utilization protein HutZ [Marinomonas agarivorans]|nr:heme utilization protein HutZ [Marinomonas agarivorans]
MKNTRLQQSLITEIEAFLLSQKSLMLSTIDSENIPHASYAPFGIYQQHLYIFVSQLASHTQHLLQSKTASVLIIEDEAASDDVFARKRLSYQVSVIALERSDSLWTSIIDSMKQRFGDNMDVLSQLGDFILFQLTPVSGRYVKGFGKAYDLTGESLSIQTITHLSGVKRS